MEPLRVFLPLNPGSPRLKLSGFPMRPIPRGDFPILEDGSPIEIHKAGTSLSDPTLFQMQFAAHVLRPRSDNSTLPSTISEHGNKQIPQFPHSTKPLLSSRRKQKKPPTEATRTKPPSSGGRRTAGYNREKVKKKNGTRQSKPERTKTKSDGDVRRSSSRQDEEVPGKRRRRRSRPTPASGFSAGKCSSDSPPPRRAGSERITDGRRGRENLESSSKS